MNAVLSARLLLNCLIHIIISGRSGADYGLETLGNPTGVLALSGDVF